MACLASLPARLKAHRDVTLSVFHSLPDVLAKLCGCGEVLSRVHAYFHADSCGLGTATVLGRAWSWDSCGPVTVADQGHIWTMARSGREDWLSSEAWLGSRNHESVSFTGLFGRSELGKGGAEQTKTDVDLGKEWTEGKKWAWARTGL